MQEQTGDARAAASERQQRLGAQRSMLTEGWQPQLNQKIAEANKVLAPYKVGLVKEVQSRTGVCFIGWKVMLVPSPQLSL